MRIVGKDMEGVLVFALNVPVFRDESERASGQSLQYVERRYGCAFPDISESVWGALMDVHEYAAAMVDNLGHWGKPGKALTRAIACEILEDDTLAGEIHWAMRKRFNSGSDGLNGRNIARSGHCTQVREIAHRAEQFLIASGLEILGKRSHR